MEPVTDSAIQYLAKRASFVSRLSNLLLIYVVAGAVLAIGGFGYILYLRLGISISPQERTAFVVGISGVFLSVFALSLLSYRRAQFEQERERDERYHSMARFIETWNVLEEASKRLAFEDQADRHRSIRETLSVLKAKGKLSSSEMFDIEDLLRLRNSIVHGSITPPISVIKEGSEKLAGLLTKFL